MARYGTLNTVETSAAEEFGKAVRARRTALGLSRSQLAERAGVSVPFLERLERPGPPPPRRQNVISVAMALTLDVHQVLAQLGLPPLTSDEEGVASGDPWESLRRWWPRLTAVQQRAVSDLVRAFAAPEQVGVPRAVVMEMTPGSGVVPHPPQRERKPTL